MHTTFRKRFITFAFGSVIPPPHEIMALSQENIQTQEQQQVQTQEQRLTAQHVLSVRLLEMPLAKLEEKIVSELQDNDGLEADPTDSDYGDVSDGGGTEGSDDGYAGATDSATDDGGEAGGDDAREDELERVLDGLDSDDRMETSNYDRMHNSAPDADQEERIYGQTESFYDNLKAQLGEQELSERQTIIMDHLIGSLDSDGLLRKDIALVCDEIAIREYIDVSEDEVQSCLTMLQTFDPPGVGARSLQECMLLQIKRKHPSRMTTLMERVVTDCFTDLIRHRWDRINTRLQLTDAEGDEVLRQIKRLNPRPGASLSETMGRNTEQVTPDFIVEVDDNDRVTFHLNSGNIPSLHVSHDYEEQMDGYRKNPGSMTRGDKEALLYMQQRVLRARNFIEAIRLRQQSMTRTMQVLITLQHDYFVSGDEWDLKPMKLADVAQRAGVDVSTVSRVCASKYADTPWGIIPLKTLFSNSMTNDEGEEMSTRRIKNALRTLIESETPGKAMSDIKLVAEMERLGFKLARRTVAKYREQMGIPPSHMR